jgi:putative DNA primase/helicase
MRAITAYAPATLPEAVAALHYVPALDRETWYRMGMALKSAFGEGAFEAWDDWSQSADNYRAKDAPAVWKSMQKNGIGIGSLFGAARQYGYRPTSKPQLSSAAAIAEREWKMRGEEAKCQQGRADARDRAARYVREAKPSDDAHPYLQRKGIKSHGLGIHHGPQAINGMPLNGCLVIPLRDTAGAIHSVEFIHPEPREGDNKRFLANGEKSGHYYQIGEPDDVLCIAEGFATGASIHEATGHAVAVAFDAGNLEPVARALRAKHAELRLIVCADDDYETGGNPGNAKATAAARAVEGLLAVPDFGTDRPEGATDFNDLAGHAGTEAVRRCIEAAAPPKVGSESEKGSDPVKAEIRRLAMLSTMDYALARTKKAAELGINVSGLDKAVKEVQQEERALSKISGMFPVIEPWSEPVNAADLLTELCSVCRRFSVIPEHGDTLLALWIMFTYCIEHVGVAPILAIASPEKRCGKTTVLGLLTRLVDRPMPAANISPAAVFRAIEEWAPALLIDEADTFLSDNEELRGVLNSGHTRDTAYVIRTVGDDHTPAQFSTWGAKAIALIGELQDTLRDRSVVLELRRRLPHEHVEKLRHADQAEFATLRSKLKRLAIDSENSIGACRPRIPESLNDRAADNWEPLLAIAEVAGGEWPERAQEAAKALSGGAEEALSARVELLIAMRKIFQKTGQDRILNRPGFSGELRV